MECIHQAAKKAGLYPRDDELALFVDEIIATVEEFSAKVPQDPSAEVKQAKRAEFVVNNFPKYLGFLQVTHRPANLYGPNPLLLAFTSLLFERVLYCFGALFSLCSITYAV